MDLVPYIIVWYLILSGVGCIFFPFTRGLFKFFPDEGYAFTKIIGLLLLSYTVYFLSSIHLLAFTQINMIIILVVCAFINFKIYKNSKEKKFPMNFIILEEIMFLVLLAIWAYVRSSEPSIRGLEKFMDFGFINSALRTEYFPAKDMWLAGKSINYYYFGHIMGAVATKLSGIPSYISYNLILATLFSLGITQAFSAGYSIAYTAFHKKKKIALVMGSLTAFIMNLGGNLHTIYALSNGYANEKPQPIWELTAKFKLLDIFNLKAFLDKLPVGYWYPNATRFIPFTIHEFPLYSYVVADLHGHVFDIPLVLLTITVLFSYFVIQNKHENSAYGYLHFVFLGFLIAIHYMTNAFDAPIYLLLILCLSLVKNKLSKQFILESATVILSFILFSLPFTLNFEPFATGIGINCAPQFLTSIKKFGPLLFEKGNCQLSPWWMIVTLWGFFWFNFIFLLIKVFRHKEKIDKTTLFMVILCAFSTLLIFVPEFIYAKDIYPAHFRANTMFKLGYQAFIMMSLASAFIFSSIKDNLKKDRKFSLLYMFLFIPVFLLIAIYPTFAINSYYGSKPQKRSLDGQVWITTKYPEYLEIINYFNTNVKGQPVILEAQGDSYTDYNVVSSYTGLPTVAGWWVHQWLWRGSPDVVGKLIPDIQNIYESQDISITTELINKYRIEYVIIGSNEREKYKNLYQAKFEALGKAVYTSKMGPSFIYKISLDR